MSNPIFAKSVLASKTIWVNVLATVIAGLVAIQDLQWVQDNPTAAVAFALVLSVANVVLRLVTSQPVTFLSPKAPK